MPNVSWSENNIEHRFDSSAAPTPRRAVQVLPREVSTPRPATRTNTRSQSTATPSHPRGLNVPGGSPPQDDLSPPNLTINDKISHGSCKLASFPLSKDPRTLFTSHVLDTPATTSKLSHVIILYTPRQERLNVKASDSKAITVGDILLAIYHWRNKPAKSTFSGVVLSDEDDGQLILQLSSDT